MANKLGTVITVLVFVITLVVAIAVFGAFTESAYIISDDTDASTDRIEYDGARLQGTNTFVALNDGRGSSETVYKTTGFAVSFDGSSDSYATSDANINITSDGTFSVSTWVSVNSTATSDNMTVFAVNNRVLIQYLDGTWSAWYYDEGSRNSYRANITAPTPTDRTLITVSNNQTHLTIYRNTTQGESINSTTSNIASGTLNTSNCHCTLEESRGFDDATNDSEQSDLFNNPIAAQNDRNRTFRIMWDEPNENQLLIFTSTTVSVSNGEWVAGSPEQIMQSRSVLVGADYAWDKDGPQIRPLSGGELDGFPVVYASYDYATLISDQVEGVSQAYQLAALLPILLIALLIIGVVARFGQ